MHKLHSIRNYYEVLSIDVNASPADLRKAFRTAALQAHPDKEGGSKEAFHALALAFGVLSCPTTRSVYDEWLKRKSKDIVEMRTLDRSQFGAKVSAPTSRSVMQPKKRQKVSRCNSQLASKLAQNLDCLRFVLQSMSPSHRERAVSSLAPRLRLELKRYMEQHHEKTCTFHGGDDFKRHAKRSVEKTGVTMGAFSEVANNYSISKVYHSNGVKRTRYQANIHVKALRLYTLEQSNFETSVKHQIILVQMKNALNIGSMNDPDFWTGPKKALSVCECILRYNGTTESQLGLRAWVHIRAPLWLHQRCRIASTAATLAKALEVHRRLLGAREISWDALRAEWLVLLQGGRKRLSRRQAETLADRARQDTLKEQLSRTVKSVQRVLDGRTRKRGVDRVDVQ